jgi:hypothetical protein
MRSASVFIIVLLLAGTVRAQTPVASVPGTSSAPGDFGPPTVDFMAAAPERPRVWLGAEYLLWWTKSGPMPVPVLTTAPLNSPALVPGALGNPDTTVLMGGRDLNYPVQSGARFTAGSWLNTEQTVGVEASYFFLGDRSFNQSAFVPISLTSPLLVNPLLDVNPAAFVPGESGNFLFPGGGAILSSTSRLQGAEINGLRSLLDNGNARVVLIGGFRFLKLDESLTFATTQFDTGFFAFSGQFVNTVDQFLTQNNFYAGQLGARFDWIRGRIILQATGKLAMGDTHEIGQIKGFTSTNTGPGFAVGPPAQIPVTTVPGGIYAQPTNIGTQIRDRFAVAPEITLNLGVNLTQHLTGFLGYNFLYLSDVARPGNQIDRAINSSQLTSFTGVPTGPLVGPARPAPQLNSSDFWAQGVSFGLNVHW